MQHVHYNNNNLVLHKSLLVLLTGSTGPAVHLHGLTVFSRLVGIMLQILSLFYSELPLKSLYYAQFYSFMLMILSFSIYK